MLSYICIFIGVIVVYKTIIEYINTLEDKDLQNDVNSLIKDVNSALVRANLCKAFDYVINFRIRKDKRDCINVKFQSEEAYKKASSWAVNIVQIENNNWDLVRPNIAFENSIFYTKQYLDFRHKKKDYEVRVYLISTCWVFDVIKSCANDGYKSGKDFGKGGKW